MSGDLQGKVAVVTGGANGIGRAMIELFVANGAQVVIADREEASGRALAETLGPAAWFRRTDMSQAEEIYGLVDDTVARFGGLSVLVNNAAVVADNHPRFLDETLTDFERVMRVNLLGLMLGTQAAARHMAAHGGGSIINVSSTSGVTAGFGVISYRTAKAGVIHFSKSVAIDLAEYGVRVNCVAPGNISTRLNAFTPPGISAENVDAWRAELDRVRMAGQPLKRRGSTADVAEAALFLASDRSAQITGQTIAVDGGVTVGDPVNHLAAIMDAQRRMSS